MLTPFLMNTIKTHWKKQVFESTPLIAKKAITIIDPTPSNQLTERNRPRGGDFRGIPLVFTQFA